MQPDGLALVRAALDGRYSKLLVVLHSLSKSADMLILMVFFISLCIIFFATLMYYAERGTWDPDLGERGGGREREVGSGSWEPGLRPGHAVRSCAVTRVSG
jgi:hypothetical protein